MNGWKPALSAFFLAAAGIAQELPLPRAGPPPGDGGLVKPTIIVRPPVDRPAAPAVEDARQLALQAMERAVLEEEERRRVAAAAKHGSAAALRQLIVMTGPVDAAVSRASRPPVSPERQVTLIGVSGGEKVGKSLEQFFGAPLTPDREKKLLDVVRAELAGGNPAGMEVKVTGWWPKEGVMAVTLVPRGG